MEKVLLLMLLRELLRVAAMVEGLHRVRVGVGVGHGEVHGVEVGSLWVGDTCGEGCAWHEGHHRVAWRDKASEVRVHRVLMHIHLILLEELVQ